MVPLPFASPITAGTWTWRAPEGDENPESLHQSSHVFSLGCIFLDIVTWFVHGWDELEEFSTARLNEDKQAMHPGTLLFKEIPGDTYFTVATDVLGRISTTLKTVVTNHIAKLKNHKDCGEYMLQFLELIEVDMLNTNPKTRITTQQLMKRMGALVETCRREMATRNESEFSRTS
jgi:hypothetical protein